MRLKSLFIRFLHNLEKKKKNDFITRRFKVQTLTHRSHDGKTRFALSISLSINVMILPLILFLLSADVNGHDFTIEEATISDVQRAFAEQKLTSLQLVQYYIDRIDRLNPVLRAVIEVNPDAIDQAERADIERRRSNGSLPSLHGIPVLLKDSIDTKDKLNTTAGSYALLGAVVPRDAGVVARLRNAGAVILGKASMSEWYSFRSPGIPDGWCARAGQGVVSILLCNIFSAANYCSSNLVKFLTIYIGSF